MVRPSGSPADPVRPMPRKPRANCTPTQTKHDKSYIGILCPCRGSPCLRPIYHCVRSAGMGRLAHSTATSAALEPSLQLSPLRRPRASHRSACTRGPAAKRDCIRGPTSLSLRVSLSGSVSGSVLRSSGEIHRSLTCVEAQHLQLLEEGQLRRHHRHRGHRKAKLHQPARLEILQLVEIVD